MESEQFLCIQSAEKGFSWLRTTTTSLGRPKGRNTKILLCELSNSFPNIRKKTPNAYHFITINFFISHLPHLFNAGISAAVILLKIPYPEF